MSLNLRRGVRKIARRLGHVLVYVFYVLVRGVENRSLDPVRLSFVLQTIALRSCCSLFGLQFDLRFGEEEQMPLGLGMYCGAKS